MNAPIESRPETAHRGAHICPGCSPAANTSTRAAEGQRAPHSCVEQKEQCEVILTELIASDGVALYITTKMCEGKQTQVARFGQTKAGSGSQHILWVPGKQVDNLPTNRPPTSLVVPDPVAQKAGGGGTFNFKEGPRWLWRSVGTMICQAKSPLKGNPSMESAFVSTEKPCQLQALL